MVEFEEPAITYADLIDGHCVCILCLLYRICPTVPPQRNYDTDTPVPAVRKPLEQPIPKVSV